MKIRNFLKKNIFSIIGGIMVLGTSIVLADNLQASAIYFDKQNSIQYGATKDYVQDAIDELYAKGQAKLATVQAQANATTIYSMPRVIYLDPTNLSKLCRLSDTNVGANRTTSKPCMKWYIYGETRDRYIAILDHNTTDTVSNWSTALTQVDTDSSTWQTVLSSDNTKHARLITGKEVADIVGNTTWTSSGSDFYFEGSPKTGTGTSKYAWLYDYTRYCTSYGCNTASSNSSLYGYWTSTAKDASRAWLVGYYGYLGTASVSYSNSGIRPVIEISKSVLLNRS